MKSLGPRSGRRFMPCEAKAFGGIMGHDWVFDVLRDLKVYALANGFAGLAVKVEEALVIADQEIMPQAGPGTKRPDQGTTH
jgi:hypothetical protein